MTCHLAPRALLCALATLLATGCVERVLCADVPTAPGCTPPADSGPDAQTDGGDGDAGPCGACPAATPLCREADGECVACLGDGDCGGDTPLCDTDAGACVGCLRDADCDDPTAARCEAGACTGCDDSLQCAGITGTEVCDTDAVTCVQCTTDERDACGGNVCDGADHTCTTRPERSKGLCQDCVADAECRDGQLCVAMTFEGTDVGRFCLWREDAPGGAGGNCLSVRPYVETESLTSVDGVTTNICTLRQTTCVALNQFDMMGCTVGTPPPAATDSECGFTGVDDGLCRVRSGPTNRCTTPCLSDDDCLPGSSCNTAATPRYCEF